jgi:hypothetical protein
MRSLVLYLLILVASVVWQVLDPAPPPTDRADSSHRVSASSESVAKSNW